MYRDEITFNLASSDHQLQPGRESHSQSHEQITNASVELLISEHWWRHPSHWETWALLQSCARLTKTLTQLGSHLGLTGCAKHCKRGDTRLCWECQARHRGDEFRFGGSGSLWLRHARWTHIGRVFCHASQHTDDKVLRFHRVARLWSRESRMQSLPKR